MTPEFDCYITFYLEKKRSGVKDSYWETRITLKTQILGFLIVVDGYR